MNQIKSVVEDIKYKNKRVSSLILKDDTMVEMVYSPQEEKTHLAILKDRELKYQDSILINDTKFIPYPAKEDIIKNGVILFPGEAREYGDDKKLQQEIQNFIHKYLDVSPLFERLASYYVLFTWVYDRFNELPYLRALADYGSGKTRFLQTIGSLCYKPIFAGGATTTSPIFRLLEAFGGTLILDEADFKHSEAWSEIIKILNCGYMKGFPVLRSEGKRFTPKGFSVFGPKIIATRSKFQDKALESRFIIEELEKDNLREDIPINLPESFWQGAQELRNKLLLWRFRNYHTVVLKPDLISRLIEPRLSQIMTPLLSIIEDKELIQEVKNFITQYNQQIIQDRGMEFEAQVLEIIIKLIASNFIPSMKDIAEKFNQELEDQEPRISSRKVGWIVRERLKLRPKRKRGKYLITFDNVSKIKMLAKRYGIKLG